jgi:hypothetical protein
MVAVMPAFLRMSSKAGQSCCFGFGLFGTKEQCFGQDGNIPNHLSNGVDVILSKAFMSSSIHKQLDKQKIYSLQLVGFGDKASRPKAWRNSGNAYGTYYLLDFPFAWMLACPTMWASVGTLDNSISSPGEQFARSHVHGGRLLWQQPILENSAFDGRWHDNVEVLEAEA